MDLTYFPGCTLKTKARSFEDSAIAAMAALGVNLVELPRWNCCGTVYCLADDDLAHHVAPVRDLMRVREQGGSRVVTLCSFCYNTLKRADLLMKSNPESLDALNSFMDDETPYDGQAEVVHLLQLLRDDLGWEAIAQKVKNPLKSLSVAPYYGCTLTRPMQAAIDSVEKPTVLQRLLETCGATVIDFPLATECCGSFQIMAAPDAVAERSATIVDVAARLGAEVIALSCPLCSHNLEQAQARSNTGSTVVPIVYFTQLLALALGVEPERWGFSPDAETLLQEKDLLPRSE